MKISNLSMPTGEKLAFMTSLATMLSAGITLLEAIDSLLEDAKGNQKKLLQVLKEDVTQGKKIYTTFEKFPQIFDKVSINIVKAAEEAGTLDTTLKQIRDNTQKEMEFMDRVKSAMMYPIFIMFVFIGVLLMILIVVVPKIATVFSRLKTDLPLPTKLLIFLSNLIMKSTVPFVTGLVIFFILLIIIFKTQKKFLIQILFSLPLISVLIRKIDLTRFTRSLSMLLKSGILINNALDLVEEVVINPQIKKMIVRTKENVLAGRKFSEGLRSSKKYVPVIMLKIIEAGERSGSLEESLAETANYLDYEVSGNLKTLTTLLEPVMLVFVAVAVGGMMMAIIAPIYNMIGQVGSR